MDRFPTPTVPRLAAVLMVLASMTSCQSASAPEPRPPAANAAPAPVPVPEVQPRRNPAPREGYALLIAFDDLPASITDITATADFQVANPDSVPLDHTRAVGGVRLVPEHRVPLALTRLDDGRYAATVHRDALLDEDYFGLGTSHWALASVSVRFHSPSTRFIGGLPGDALADGTRQVQHYLVRDAAHRPATMDVVFGEAPGFYQASAGPQFTFTLTARREAP